jgi:hypothetical protein
MKELKKKYKFNYEFQIIAKPVVKCSGKKKDTGRRGAN